MRQLKIQRQTAVRERELTNASLGAVFMVLPDLYFRLNEDGTILDFQTQNPDELYTNPKQFLGKRMQDILPAKVGQLFHDAFKKVLDCP